MEIDLTRLRGLDSELGIVKEMAELRHKEVIIALLWNMFISQRSSDKNIMY